MASRALLVTLLLCTAGAGARAESASAALSAHIDTLLAEYDREVPPRAPVAVTLALDVRHAAVSDRASAMRLLADLQMSWTDARLAWNATQWEGDAALVPAARLWTPDVELVSAGEARGAGDAVRARVARDGAVTRVLRLDLAAPLPLRLASWPRDRQRADFAFASRAHSVEEIDLLVADYRGSVVTEAGAWEVRSVTGARAELRGAGEGATRAVTWSVVAARRGAALSAQHGALLAAAALLLTAAAARPYTQRVPLAACAALLAAAWLVAAGVAVPAASSTPLVVSVMCAMCALGAASGAGAALAQAVARRGAPPPAALRTLLSKVSAIHTITPDPECLSESRSGAWAAAAQLLDVVLVTLVALAQLVLIGVYVLA